MTAVKPILGIKISYPNHIPHPWRRLVALEVVEWEGMVSKRFVVAWAPNLAPVSKGEQR